MGSMVVKSISEFSQVEKDGFDQLFESCPFATPFHRVEWLNIIEKIFDEKVYCIYNEDIDGCMDFIFPFLLRKDFLYWDVHSFSMNYELVYGAPLFVCGRSLPADNVIDNSISGHLHRVKSVIMYLPPKFPYGYLPGRGIRQIYNTPIIDISSNLDDLWSSLPYKNVRCNINKAYKSGVTVQVDTKHHLEAFHAYHQKTLGAFEREVPPLTYYEHVAALPFVRIFSAMHANRPIAVGIIVVHRDTVYYWNNASSLEHRNLRPNDLLVWEIIKWSKDNGYRYFDFLITPLNELSGLSRFKLKFGGSIHPVYQYCTRNFFQFANKTLQYIAHPKEIFGRLFHRYPERS